MGDNEDGMKMEVEEPIEVPEDEQPQLEGHCVYVSYEGQASNGNPWSHPMQFADKEGYQTRFSKEIDNIKIMQNVLDRGEQFMSTLYTYRSISKALPAVKGEEKDQIDLYNKVYEILAPGIQTFQQFYEFHKETTQVLCGNVEELLKPEKKKDIPSDSHFDHLIKVLDMILKLDALKNMKAALSNDFSFFKRATQKIRRDVGQRAEDINLQQFLAVKGSIMRDVQDALKKIQGFHEVIIQLINYCADNLESKRYLFVDEKHALLRVCAFGIYLIDFDTTLKRLNLQRFSKLFKRYPVLTLYCDMSFKISTILSKCPNYLATEWTITPNEQKKLLTKYLIIHRLTKIRQTFNTFTAQYSLVLNKLKRYKAQHVMNIPEQLRGEIRNLTERGLKYVASWTARVLEQSAWKYCFPADIPVQSPTSPNVPTTPNTGNASESSSSGGDKSAYERVVRYNYTGEERAALVDVIAMIKGLETSMARFSNLVAPILRTQIHLEVQNFLQFTLRDMIMRAAKLKRPVLQTLLLLRDIGADWKTKAPPKDDPILSGKRGEPSGWVKEVPLRITAPTYTQLHLLRCIVGTSFPDRSPGMIKKGLFGDVDFSHDQVKELKEFYDISFFYIYLLDYATNLRRASDLADLWYKEFYLEVASQIQFPIELSLPWLLTEDILEKRNATLMDSVLFPLAIYNDAAYRALFVLQRRYLYDEVEAEVNLVFDQLIFKLSEQIYTNFKIRASNILLNKQLRTNFERGLKVSKFNPPKSRYEVLLQQKRINLLGRFVDLNALIGQRLNNSIRENLNFAISRFESADLSSIVDLELLVDNIRLTHQLLAEHLTLDPFDNILAEIDDRTSLVSLNGRIAFHITEELFMDFFPCMTYNTTTQRYLRAPGNSPIDYEREKAPKIPGPFLFGTKTYNQCFMNYAEQFRSYFGSEHIQSIVKLLGQDSIALIGQNCISFIETKICTDLNPYIPVLHSIMPPAVRLQTVQTYGLKGAYEYFKAQFRDFASYADLKSGVYQYFREVGNAITFLLLLDNNQMTFNVASYMNAASFTNLRAKNNLRSVKQILQQNPPQAFQEQIEFNEEFRLEQCEEDNTSYLRCEEQNSSLVQSMSSLKARISSNNIPSKSPFVLDNIAKNAQKVVSSHNPPVASVSLFKRALESMSQTLGHLKTEWVGGQPSTAERLLGVDSSKEFYRLWGALQFLYCVEENKDEYTACELFGDGFLWAGCTILYLFEQQVRFDTFNFSDLILNMITPTSKDRELVTTFIDIATSVRQLNNKIFQTLKTYMTINPPTQIEIYRPPENEDFLKQKFVSMIENHTVTGDLSSFSPNSSIDEERKNSFNQ